MYLVLLRRRWYALHDIPADVQPKLGRKRFKKSLGVEDRKTAERRAAVLLPGWLSEIERARASNPQQCVADAEFWRTAVKNAKTEEERELLLSALDDELDEKVYRAAARAGITDAHDPEFHQLPERQEANRMFAIAAGTLVAYTEHMEEYLATLGAEEKTIFMKRSTITKFGAEFPFVDDVAQDEVQQWVNRQLEAGSAASTIRRRLSELRGYWKYLQSISKVPRNLHPFDHLTVPKKGGKAAKADERRPFTAAEVVKLHSAALAKRGGGDQQLADLIELGMWTGARIEELCALPVSKVHDDHFEIEDAKSAAGWRKVPIHSKLAATVTRLKEASTDGFLLSGLEPNKFGDRSTAMSKRFGYLKTGAGFDKRYVFHSIRKTVTTLLENAGVSENVAADIIGHEKPRITYGLYSGGTELSVMRDAIEKLNYPSYLPTQRVLIEEGGSDRSGSHGRGTDQSPPPAPAK